MCSRRLSLLGDGLAHVTFGSVALGLLLKVQPIYISVPVVALSSVAILKLTERARVYSDAAIGIVSAFGVSGGVMLGRTGGGLQRGPLQLPLRQYTVDHDRRGHYIPRISLVVLSVIAFRYSALLSLSFDEEFARTCGINTGRINALLAVLAAVTVVLAMKLVGIMLTSALLIIPAVSAFR